MHKKTFVIGLILVLATAWCMNAYAANEAEAWHGFWDSIGGFCYNALPWNWGSWLGK